MFAFCQVNVLNEYVVVVDDDDDGFEFYGMYTFFEKFCRSLHRIAPRFSHFAYLLILSSCFYILCVYILFVYVI